MPQGKARRTVDQEQYHDAFLTQKPQTLTSEIIVYVINFPKMISIFFLIIRNSASTHMLNDVAKKAYGNNYRLSNTK